MKFTLLLILTFSNTFLFGQKVREYFFENLSTTDTLVIFSRDPQTEIANQLDNRIYSDSAFLRKIKNEFYEEYEFDQKLTHFCGFDLFFYKLSNGKLVFLNELNSTCGLSQFACKETGLSLLLESGKYLKIDTLFNTPKSRQVLREKLQHRNVLLWKYSTQLDWDIRKTSKFPKICYDGYFKTKIVLDTNYSLAENMNYFLLKYTSNCENINWNIRQEWNKTEGNSMKLKRFERLKESVEIEVEFYLNKTDFQSFKKMKITRIDFKINPDFPLLIFYKSSDD